LLDAQDPDGSWRARHGSERTHGANYATCMALLALAVEYQYLPIYQR
ncbi:MAG TPA: prenyltransferase, partial [Planctomycetaceae bacterium]|nr:prenyltransferase [Planctomycetaceae bacterium]